MNSREDIARFIGAQPEIRQLLKAVADLALADAWIGAGLIRNAVWDELHGFPVTPHASSDIDVAYYDTSDVSPQRDKVIETQLQAGCPHVTWDVHNQAHMHLRNGDAPYLDTEDAIRHWPDTATAVAARVFGDQVTVTAPHGVDDLLGLIVRPTPAFASKADVTRKRRASKNWAERWPKLTFLSAEGSGRS